MKCRSTQNVSSQIQSPQHGIVSAVVRRGLVCGGTTAECDSGTGSKGGKKSYKTEKSTGVIEGGGAAWKHREETALHPDSVTENKDNLFPSDSITQFSAQHMEMQCREAQYGESGETHHHPPDCWHTLMHSHSQQEVQQSCSGIRSSAEIRHTSQETWLRFMCVPLT